MYQLHRHTPLYNVTLEGNGFQWISHTSSLPDAFTNVIRVIQASARFQLSHL